MKTVKLSAAGAIVRYLAAQHIDASEVEPIAGLTADGAAGPSGSLPLFGGVFAIFGHGNVTCLGPELRAAADVLPTYRGQNEQGMALAALAYARAAKRRRIMVAASSIGPGATNMVTAAAAATSNRMPLLLLSGDTFNSRAPDPVLQQIEQFGDPTVTANDAFRPVVRYWDRITHPAQVVHALPNALATMLDPSDCGAAFVGLPQDTQAETYDYPERFFEPVVHRIRRPRPDRAEVAAAAGALAQARRPLVIAGGGVRWSLAEGALAEFCDRHRIPVVETFAGRSSLASTHPANCGPIGVAGCAAASALAQSADVVLAVGTRLGDFATGSWTIFGDESMRLVALNTARFDATKHRALPVVADAREGLAELSAALGGYVCDEAWVERASAEATQYHQYIDKIAAPVEVASPAAEPVTYAQVVGAVDRWATGDTYVVTAAGGLPGELLNGWRSDTVHSFDCEFGYSTMGYEIAGGWGAKLALAQREVVVLVGDGSYLMMNSDLYSTVLSGDPLIVVVCDNGGFAVINRLQMAQGGEPFNNLLSDCRGVADGEVPPRVDFAQHAASMGCDAVTVRSVDELSAALDAARGATTTQVIVVEVDAYLWTEGGAAWQVGVSPVAPRDEITQAAAAMSEQLAAQRVGW